MNLTAATVTKLCLAPGERDRIWFDAGVPGFGLRARASGARSWIYQYKLGNKTRRMVIGAVSAIKPARAREIASELHARVKLGGDPAGEKHVRVERAQHTFGSLVDRYFERDHKLRPGSLREIERHLRQHAAPLHKLPIDTIDQRAIADRLSTIERTSGAVTANRTRAAMSAMFTWAMKEGLALANPVINTNKRTEKPRDRVLNYAELRSVWNALEDDQYGGIVKLLMLTGQRLNEIAGLRWSEVHFDRNLISLPSTRTKNGRPHDIPMSPAVRALLKAQPRREGRDLIFGRREGPFSGFSRCKAMLDKRITEMTGSALPPWVIHDIRRSVATRMAERGVPPHVIEALLNHVSGHKAGIAGVYNLASYEKEKAQAVALWDGHLLAAVRSKVTA